MRWNVRFFVAAAMLLGGLSLAGSAGATAINMDFDTIPGGVAVNNYYNGGCSGRARHVPKVCGGPADGVTWTGNSQVGAGSSSNVLQVSGFGGNTTMSVAGGFTQLAFDYDFTGFAFSVTFYDGLDGAGTAISTGLLGLLGSCTGCQADFTLATPAHSAVFSWFLASASLDNMNVSNSVPEPAALGTFALGLLLIGGFLGWRRRGTHAGRHTA